MRTGNNMGKSHDKLTSCPIGQMSFGEVSRYLQGGFDSAVQTAISSHILYCNSCREQLDRFKTLRSAGRHIMDVHVEEPVSRDDEDHFDDGIFAAYVDGTLDTSMRERVSAHLGTCHACYLQFSALEKELATPVPRALRAPSEVTEAMKVPVAQPREVIGFAELGRRVVDVVEDFLGLRWTQPALAFAVGVLVMLMFLPSSRTVIPLPGFSPVQNGFDDRVRSSVDGQVEEADRGPVIMIPAEAKGKLEFTWPGNSGLKEGVYRVEIFDQAGIKVLDSQEVTENKWAADVSIFRPGARYDILVSRIGKAGGVQPISQQTLLVTP